MNSAILLKYALLIAAACTLSVVFALNRRQANQRDYTLKSALKDLYSSVREYASRYTFPFMKSSYQRKYADEKEIILVIPSYKNAEWYKWNIESILMQNYNNYRVIYIADGCTSPNYDGTGELVEEHLNNHPLKEKFTVIKNQERKGALRNLYEAIITCPDNAIIATLDGDDWLYHENVLALLNDLYHDDIWLTHGTFIEYPTRLVRWSEAIPENVIEGNNFRSYKCASHLRTFYAWLFKKIKKEDLLDQHDEFYPMTWDQAMMFPMCEMAGKRQAFIAEPIYVYNTANQINDWKVNAQLQRDLEQEIRNKEKYQSL